jgi:class 3 adenylate cyclase
VRAVVDRGFDLLRRAVAAHGGRVFRTQGDGLCAAFATASRRPRHGPIRASPVLGGLHHAHERVAWTKSEFCRAYAGKDARLREHSEEQIQAPWHVEWWPWPLWRRVLANATEHYQDHARAARGRPAPST